MTYKSDVRTRNKNAGQREQAREDQVQNHEGGYVFKLDAWAVLDRFLVLGTVGGTYYCGQREATKEAIEPIKALITSFDGRRVVARTVEISDNGRAPKNEPAILVLALALTHGDAATKEAAVKAVPQICRIGTHILTLADYLSGLRGWGRVAKKALHSWFTAYDSERLAYQAVKYKQRNGWALRDLLRLSHYTAKSERRRAVLHYIVKGELSEATEVFTGLMGLSAENVVDRVKRFDLPWEALPTEMLQRADVWDALSARMPPTALIRNLGRLSSLGVISPMSAKAKAIGERIADAGVLKRARVHPLFLLTAWAQYREGHGDKGSMKWAVSGEITEALEAAYYAAFDAVTPTGKRHYLALDVSGSMGSRIAGTAITCAQGSACLAAVTHAVEPSTYVAGFCAGSSRTLHAGYGTAMTQINLPKRQALGAGIHVSAFGGTDCALPMLDAMQKGIEADAFVIYTDNETWAGNVHPFKALQQYRQKTGINAKLVVVGMTATEFSIADPTDAGMLDVVGFDTTLPQAIASFVM